MSILDVGCCGAYCGTCPVLKDQTCKGCKIGYEDGERDILKAKCRIKVCCINRKQQSCADCNEYSSCSTVNDFYNKNSYKYRKYKQATDYIRMYGYEAFLNIADTWKNAHGKY
ncbi:DUF3795 domain-containing protein [Pseudobacteroides cellulosolvens]|uniref:DUF3795 domain-containing protein n=1 Tax=Pseudobacteroides cellulosolvens ATCC 35603 = DSM 2933 TaxID=398512 RepID=A0A0L6JMF6_9FIRM|nr:DUF3795 domain-containing protein [Pseudobacteroides cellulosolvens]KNY26940.1 Protein of unknown function DUF3795 [Pseudobacteroides cellulosolvens ATCC 35603 = DSM 2933]